jgi:general stress protein YciG
MAQARTKNLAGKLATRINPPTSSTLNSKESKMASNQGNERDNEHGKGAGSSQKTEGQGAQKVPAKRGFAAMNEEQQREIASKGGQAAHQKGTAHEFDSEEARRAGQKGGEAVSRNREHMAEIGRKGGESRQSANRDNESRSSTASRSGTSESSTRAGRQGSNKDDKS